MTVTAPQIILPQGWVAHSRDLAWLGVPLIGSNLAQYLIHLTDVVLLGWYDVQALAAITLATALYFMIFLLGAGFGWAVMPLVAAAVEADDHIQVRRVTRMGLWLSVAFGVAVSIPMMWAEPFFLAIGQDPQVSALAQDYLTIGAWAMIPGLMVVVLRALLAALERTAVILWATLGAAAVNALIGWALIFGRLGLPEMGIAGAAWAALGSTILMGLILLVYVLRHFPAYRLTQRLWRPDPGTMARVFRLGAPIGLTSLAEGALFSASAVMVGWIGAVELAAHGIAMQLASLTFMFHMGLSQAATVRAGRALGRRDRGNLRQVGLTAIAMSLVIGSLTVLCFVTFSENLVGLFIGLDAPARDALLQVGVSLLFMAALFQLMDAMQVVALGLLRGVQDTAVPMLLAVISYWLVGMPSGYALGFVAGWGAVGVWLGLVIGLGLAAILLMTRFWARAIRIG